MILKLIHSNDEDTAVYQLPELDMIVDPRPNSWESQYKFEVTVNGTALTVMRIDPPEDRDLDYDASTGWCDEIYFRVYLRNEFHYSFESTKYLYYGIPGERAPLDTTEVIVKDGAETIMGYAFNHRESLVKVTIPDTVTEIETGAFCACYSLRLIQLPPNLQRIGWDAFRGCKSLEAIYLSPTVTDISDRTFEGCTSLRILNIPDSVEYIGDYVIDECDSLLTDKMKEATCDERNQWLRHRYNALHNLCCQPSISPQTIQQYIQDHNDNKEERARTKDRPGFTALHLLAANPFVNGAMVTAYLQLAPDVAVMQDNLGQTPLHMLCSPPRFSEGAGGAIRAYLSCTREGKEAGFLKDNEGRTSFQCLCDKWSFDELLFLENKSFAGLMVWWYDCLDINLFMEDVDVNDN